MGKKIYDPELIKSLWDEGLSAVNIAKKIGCTHKTVYSHLSKMGINPGGRRSKPPKPTPVKRPKGATRRFDYDEAYNLHFEDGLSLTEIADRFGVSLSAVSRAFSRHGVETHSQFKKLAGLRRVRKKNRLTIMDVSELTGLAFSTLGLLETGDRRANPQTASILAKALGVSEAELETDDPWAESTLNRTDKGWSILIKLKRLPHPYTRRIDMGDCPGSVAVDVFKSIKKIMMEVYNL